jgi:hypothetical protein
VTDRWAKLSSSPSTGNGIRGRMGNALLYTSSLNIVRSSAHGRCPRIRWAESPFRLPRVSFTFFVPSLDPCRD